MTDTKLATVKMGSRGLVVDDMESLYRLAVAVSKSPDMRPKSMDTPEKCLVAMQYGLELGLQPMQAISSIAVVNGRPAVYGEALIAVANASGLIKEVIEDFEETSGGMTAKCTIVRSDGRETTGEFSIEDAKKANLWGKGGPWSSYPKRMLMWRARGFAYRDGVPEALRGLWFREEAEDIRPIKDVTPQEPPSAPDPLLVTAGESAVLKEALINSSELVDDGSETESAGAPPPAHQPADGPEDRRGCRPPGHPLVDMEYLTKTAEDLADQGYVKLESFFQGLSLDAKLALQPELSRLKERAAKADIGPIGA